MSILEKLNPKNQAKKQFKQLFFKRLPQIREDLSLMLDSMFLDMADQNKTNPFTIKLLLLRRGKEAIGVFFNEKGKEIGAFDAAALIQSLFKTQLDSMPEMIKGYVLDELGTEDTTKMVVKALTKRRLLIHYDENEQFAFVEVTKKDKKVIDLDEFFNTFDF